MSPTSTSARRCGAECWTGTAQGRPSAGIVVVRAGENVLKVVEAVKKKIAELEPSFPPGVELEIAYDRSELIHRAIDDAPTRRSSKK